MSFLTPTAALIAAAATIPPLVALYLLKHRRRPLRVSSTLLWRKAIEDMQVNAPFQKLRKNLLLLLQLIILAAILFALARPVTRGQSQESQRIVLIVDCSGSMRTNEGGQTRLELARKAAADLIENAAANSAMTIISFAENAAVVEPWTDDRALLRRAVNGLKQTDQRSRLESAMQLVEPFAMRQVAREGAAPLSVYVLSDGRLHDTALPEVKGTSMQYVRIGAPETQNNIGIVSVDARRDYRNPQSIQMHLRLNNYANQPATCNVTIRVNGVVEQVIPVSLAAATQDAAASQSMLVPLDITGSALIDCAHDHEDLFPTDNRVWLKIAPPRQLNVLLVSEGNPFLNRALQAGGTSWMVKLKPDVYETVNPDSFRREGWDGGKALPIDVIVFDRYRPKTLPPIDSITFGQSPPIDGLRLLPPHNDAEYAQALLDWNRRHPLMRYVEMDTVEFVLPPRLQLPDEAELLATGPEGPVLAAVQVENVRHIVAAFDLYQSNWPMQVSFPVFISNALQWLALGDQIQAGRSYRPGAAAVVSAPPDIKDVQYAGPTTLNSRVVGPRIVTPTFPLVGLYQAAPNLPPPADQLAVNLADSIESDIRTVDHISSGTQQIATTSTSRMIRRERWRWFIWAAMAVLLVEWLVYTRRWNI